jgi:hypothetical protein
MAIVNHTKLCRIIFADLEIGFGDDKVKRF